MKLHQVIVVEGEHDRRAVLNALEADIEITGGFALTEDLIQRLNFLQEKRGLIILTDPDYTGEVIRRCLQKRIPGVEHAYYQNQKPNGKGILVLRTPAQRRFVRHWRLHEKSR
jgi:ribonuclease M5